MTIAPSDEVPRDRMTYRSGLVVGVFAAAIATGSYVYWRGLRRKRKCGCVGGRADEVPSTTTRSGRTETGYVFMPDGCVARPPRTFSVMRQIREFVAPNTLTDPRSALAGTELTVIGVFTAIRDGQGRARCDVALAGNEELLGAFLSADDFPAGPCRGAFAAALAGSPAPSTTA